MGMWHVTKKLILLLGLFLKGIAWDGGGQGDVHKHDGWGKLMLPIRSYLVWEGGLHGDLYGVIDRASVGGLARRCGSWCMPQLID